MCEENSQNRFDIELFEKVDKLTKAWENYLWLKEKFPEKFSSLMAIKKNKRF